MSNTDTVSYVFVTACHIVFHFLILGLKTHVLCVSKRSKSTSMWRHGMYMIHYSEYEVSLEYFLILFQKDQSPYQLAVFLT